ncbi:shikimate 5-dehydrogenase [Corynebacterium deserti GIMN1.010]|uniref:shikimate dehydrogenase (NADP(+)) n=1 Tax=Corynebacterium deserti GIMN1.010 TaxID=931089 RepID=A0A0M5ILP8_9CORY|nr:shikimate dehydrogenase [Corynebacterium deserti]ALC06031.1 shikimate 5-dehydrogenase [Corynebacterium deserti GIMN1.010]
MSSQITHRAAVLGSPIEHSKSPVLHTAGFTATGLTQWEYLRFECTADQLPEIVGGADESFQGFSVTMPAKFAALRFATEVTERARAIGSANTLVRTADGWRADNTDVDGIRGALTELLHGASLSGKRAVVVGSGGTARPAIFALIDMGVAHITVVNRSDRTGELKELFDATSTTLSYLPLNQSAAGATSHADVVISTVPASAIAGLEVTLAKAPVMDVIYDPWPTPLVLAARAAGKAAIGGHVMLACQAYGQFEQFTGVKAPTQDMRAALDKELGF